MNQATTTTADQIACYLIWASHQSGSFISNLKLRKLLYYAQAWYLALYDKPLFPERFQAGIHGPVIPSLYSHYQRYGWKNIDDDCACPEFDQETIDFLEELLDEYGALDARRLEWLTQHERPWMNARGDLSVDEPCTNEIDENLMKTYYRARLSGAAVRPEEPAM
jgi:uncharacterized phage-associated protein